MIDRINKAINEVSHLIGIRNTNDNITITVSCSDKEIDRISKEVYEEAERTGILHKVETSEPNNDPDKIRITKFQSPLGKLILIPNGE